MSRTYSNRSASSDEGAGVILLILLVGTFYTHRTVIIKAEQYAMIVAIGISILVGLVALLRVTRKIRNIVHMRRPTIITIDTMDGLAFEKYIANLLRSRGYSNVQLTEQYDFGVDIIAKKDNIRWGIQVKRHNGLVKAAAVRQVVTALKMYHCDRAMVVTNSNFSRVAIELAESNDCLLINRNTLYAWVG